jgi:hypothetical protein
MPSIILYVVGSLLMKIILLFGFFLTPFTALEISDAIKAGTIRRPNYGLTFHYEKMIYTYSEHYTHHLIFDLPDKQHERVQQYRDFAARWPNISKTPPEGDPFMQAFLKATHFQAYHVQQLIEDMYQLLPELNFTKDNRPTRTFVICKLCGTVRKYYEGVALLTDLDALNEIVHSSINDTKREVESIEKSLKALASYSRVNDQKISSLYNIIRNTRAHQDAIARVLEDREIAMLTLLNTYMANSDELLMLRNALNFLQINVLTFDILPMEQASRLLAQIQEHVQQDSFLHLTQDDVLSLYQDTNFYFFRVNTHLHIGLRIKLSPFQAPLALFRVNIFPLDIPNQDHTSFVVNAPKYVAINQQDQFYLEFPETPTFEKEKFYFLGKQEHVLLQKERPSCMLSLFHDNVVDTNRLCETNLRPFSRQPLAQYLGDKLLMLQNIAAYTVTDHSYRTWQVQTNCTACLITVPCGVKIQADKYTLFIPSCAESERSRETISVSHLANLHLIAPLVDADLLTKLSTEFTFQRPLNLTLPKMSIYQKGEDTDIDILDKPNINLARAINDTLTEGKVFKTHSDKLMYLLDQQKEAWLSGISLADLTSWIKNPFDFGSSLVTIILVLAVAYLYFRMYTMGGALILLQQAAPQVRAQDPSLRQQLENHFKPKATPPIANVTPWLFEYSPQISNQFHVLDLLILLLMIATVSYVLWSIIKRRRQQDKMDIFMDVIGPLDKIRIKLLTLPYNSNMYTFKATAFIDHVRLKGCRLFPTLRIYWPSFIIEHKILTKQTRLPIDCPINMYQAFRLTRILNSTFEILIFSRDNHSQVFKLIPLQGSIWQRVESQTPANSWTSLPWYTEQSLESPPQYV